MSANKKVAEAYLGTKERSKLGELLAEDAEWVEWGEGVPAGGVRHRGRAEFVENAGEEGDVLETDVVRMTEEGNVVVVEGLVHVTKKDGRRFDVRFCDIFEIEKGKVRRLESYGALIKGP